ncbi:hypothetical protein TWF191_006943 [Orbilia oligospora]|uniref:Uncharacterized protein n=1 Tax=Orbilia oligospora TaxID=2813651 RepID=A0A7C8V1R3_ORBOL|nr:hypothetical protein TWF191_006943 [Orbilia oligospora]
MVWDYSDRTPPLRPDAARLRFIPPLVLGSYKIPHVIWGNDASICHEVPSSIWDSMHILVPKAYLETAAKCLTEYLPFKRTVFPPNEDQLLPCYSDECILLASKKKLCITANYIILIPDILFHFDATNPTSIQTPPSYFELPSEFDKVGVPSFPALVSAYLLCLGGSGTQNFTGFQKGRWRMGDLRARILGWVVTLIAWRRRELWKEYYNSSEEFPVTLKKIRNCISLESIPIFDERCIARKSFRDLKKRSSFLLDEEEGSSLPPIDFGSFAKEGKSGHTQLDRSIGGSAGHFESQLRLNGEDEDEDEPEGYEKGTATQLGLKNRIGKEVDLVAQALQYKLKSYFDRGALYFVGGFAIRAKGSDRVTNDVDLEFSELGNGNLRILISKIESSGFNISKETKNGFDAVDKATGVKVNVRVRSFQGVNVGPFSTKCGGYDVVCDDVQLIQKLNALPNRRDITKQKTDLMDINFLLTRGLSIRKELVSLFHQKEALLKGVRSGRIVLQDGGLRAQMLIKSLEEKGLSEIVDFINVINTESE